MLFPLATYKAMTGFRAEHFKEMPLARNPIKRSSRQVFYHSGDYGDIIYALPTIRAAGGGELVLGPDLKLNFTTRTRLTLTNRLVDMLAPLLEAQSYVSGVTFAAKMPDSVTCDLNSFRYELLHLKYTDGRLCNLAESHLAAQGLPYSACYEPWLKIDAPASESNGKVLIHRSERWLNPVFPWKDVLDVHGSNAVFVGLEHEWRAFTKLTGYKLPYRPTKDFLELAQLIAGCALFIGNQSAPYAIAEGLHKRSLLEVWPDGPNCLFPRKNAYYGRGKIVYIPKLETDQTTELVACPGCGATDCEQVRLRAEIVRCCACSLVYLRARPNVTALESHYQAYADDHSHMRLPRTIDEVRGSGLRRDYFLDDVLAANANSTHGTLLDIGCGWGAFLHNARQRGFSVRGIEICARAAEFADSVLGIPVSTRQFMASGIKPSTLSVVTLIHVLEHLPDTARVLAAIHDTLRPGGLLAGIVPNYGSLCSNAQRDDWEWLDPTMHYVHFTADTLRNVLSAAGFELVRMYTHTGDFNQQTVAQELQRKYTVTEPEHIQACLDAEYVAMGGEELRFFARKPL